MDLRLSLHRKRFLHQDQENFGIRLVENGVCDIGGVRWKNIPVTDPDMSCLYDRGFKFF